MSLVGDPDPHPLEVGRSVMINGQSYVHRLILAPSVIIRLGGSIRDSTVVLELVILIPVEFTPEPSSTVLL